MPTITGDAERSQEPYSTGRNKTATAEMLSVMVRRSAIMSAGRATGVSSPYTFLRVLGVSWPKRSLASSPRNGCCQEMVGERGSLQLRNGQLSC